MTIKLPLPYRLAAIFALTLAALTVIAFTTFRITAQEQPHSQAAVRLFNRIAASIGAPPRTERAAELARILDIGVVIRGAGTYWSSDPNLPDLRHIGVADGGQSGIAFANVHGTKVMALHNGAYDTFIFGLNDPYLSAGGVLRLVVGIFLSLLVLVFNYLALRRLFAPMRTLHLGIDRMRGGDLNYRVKVTRQDELGELIRDVNEMANWIQQKLQSQHHLLLAIGHELHTPLTRAKVLLEMVEPGQIKEKINDNLDKLNGLINALLEAEQLDLHAKILNLTTFDLLPFLKTIIDGFADADVVRFSHSGTTTPVQADELRFSLLIHNLLANAMKYRDGKPIRVHVSYEKDFYSIDVEDQGLGIDKEHLEHITEPFYRTDSSRNRATGGFGLGLYLAAAIVKAHKGEMIINSTPGQGTRVTVRFAPTVQ
ncbi:MAG: HAMP domain-containing histidine kinase [Gammaproteobacteria bacterium]|nr:HAMP domain-containing histidine kinase [Gammaproteobacteria bacterium]